MSEYVKWTKAPEGNGIRKIPKNASIYRNGLLWNSSRRAMILLLFCFSSTQLALKFIISYKKKHALQGYEIL